MNDQQIRNLIARLSKGDGFSASSDDIQAVALLLIVLELRVLTAPPRPWMMIDTTTGERRR